MHCLSLKINEAKLKMLTDTGALNHLMHEAR